MSSNADRFEDQGDSDTPGESPILKKVRATLLKTAASQWKESGEELDPQRKYTKMVDNWEHIFLLELKKGFLVLRCSTPVLGEFHGGAYTLSPKALPNYTIELRDRSWDHRELTDIARRPASAAAASAGSKKFETLASGETARDLFQSVSGQVQQYFKQRDGEFEVVVTGILKTLEELCQNGFTSAWQKKSEHGGTVVWYRTKIDDVQVAVGRQSKRDASAHFKLIITNAENLTRSYDNPFSRKVFEAADDFDKNAGLLKLDQLLNELE